MTFKNNSAGTTGAGIHSTGSPVLDRVSFISNISVQHGGGFYSGGSPKLSNVVFSGNKVTGANTNGYGGGMYHHSGTSSLVNVTFSNNSTAHTAISGGGFYYRASGATGIYNSIFWGNTNGSGPEQLNTGTGITIANSIVEGGYASGTSILIGDPLFEDAVNHVLHLKSGSPAIGTGDNASVSAIVDRDGEPRIYDSTVDLGAYENQGGASIKITPASFPAQLRGTLLDLPLSATGGTGSYTWTLSSGNLPQGVYLSPQGVLKGVPVLTGSLTFVVAVTDGTLVGSRQYTIQVNPGVARLHVSQFANGSNSGADWPNAFKKLVDAVAISQAGDEIWVAKGTYSPGTTAASSFTLKEGVKWYGGFAATETTLAERDTSKIRTDNETILTGNNTSYHVVYNSIPLTNATVMDGFTITRGKTLTGSSGANYYGAGIYNSVATVAAVFRNLVIKNNAAAYGGGVYNIGQAIFSNVIFTDNTSTVDGAGMYDTGNSEFTAVTFARNIAGGNGGGLWKSGLSVLNGLTFTANKGANGGGMYNSSGNSVLAGAAFTGNMATV
ncbi:MAG TPA: choice-of-anchor Q domain-containing protein, partial [Flavisolibacter sp.]